MELSEVEWKALESLGKYGPAEDCRSGLAEVAAYELLAIKGLAWRRHDETGITDGGREALRAKRAQ